MAGEYYFIPDKVSNSGGIITGLRAGERVDLRGMKPIGEAGGYGLAYRIDPDEARGTILGDGYTSPFITKDEQGRYLYPLSTCLKVSTPKEGMSWDDVRKNVNAEYEQLKRADGAGGLVPRPIAKGEGFCAYGKFYGILMEYVPCTREDFNGGRGGMTLLSNKGELELLILNANSGQSNRLSPVKVAAFSKGLCDALLGLHATRVFHRDIKPNNLIGKIGSLRAWNNQDQRITIDSITDVRIIDLGNATNAGADASIPQEARAASLRFGSPEMLWRELTDNTRRVDFGDMWGARNTEAPDLYALGCMIYYMYEGRAPFFDDGEPLPTGYEAKVRHVLDLKRPGLMLERRDGLSDEERAVEDALDRIVQATTVFDPNERCAKWSIERCKREVDDILGIGEAAEAGRAARARERERAQREAEERERARRIAEEKEKAKKRDDTLYDDRWTKGNKTTRTSQDQRREQAAKVVLGEDSFGQGAGTVRSSDGERCYQDGLATLSHDKEQAALCFREGSKKGHKGCWAMLGNMLSSGAIEPLNASEWIDALSCAGLAGNGEAWYQLGRSYEMGDHGVKPYRQFAEESYYAGYWKTGNTACGLRYAEMLLDLADDPARNKDTLFEMAENVLKDLADKGSSDASIMLGEMYETKGTALYDLDKAYHAYTSCNDVKLLKRRLAYGAGQNITVRTRAALNVVDIALALIFVVAFLASIMMPYHERLLFNRWWLLCLPFSVLLNLPHVLFFRTAHGTALAVESNDSLPSFICAGVGSIAASFGLLSLIDMATGFISSLVHSDVAAIVVLVVGVVMGLILNAIGNIFLELFAKDRWFWGRYHREHRR